MELTEAINKNTEAVYELISLLKKEHKPTISKKEAMEIIGTKTPQAITYLVKNDYLKATRPGGKMLQFKRDEVIALKKRIENKEIALNYK